MIVSQLDPRGNVALTCDETHQERPRRRLGISLKNCPRSPWIVVEDDIGGRDLAGDRIE